MASIARACVSSTLWLIASFASGCDESEGNGPMDSGTLLDANLSENDASTPATVTFNATLIDPISMTPLADSYTIHALNDRTGERLPGLMTTSQAGTGKVVFPGLPAGLVGFFIQGIPNKTGDTAQFGFIADTPAGVNEVIRLTSTSSGPIVEGAAMYTAKSDRASLAGTVYWRKTPTSRPPDGEVGFVGCAEVKIKDHTDVDMRYVGTNGVPTGPSQTKTLRTGLGAGRFYAGNAPKGLLTVEAYIGNSTVPLTVDVPVTITRAEATDGTNILVTTKIWYEGPDPTPADCPTP